MRKYLLFTQNFQSIMMQFKIFGQILLPEKVFTDKRKEKNEYRITIGSPTSV